MKNNLKISLAVAGIMLLQAIGGGLAYADTWGTEYHTNEVGGQTINACTDLVRCPPFSPIYSTKEHPYMYAGKAYVCSGSTCQYAESVTTGSGTTTESSGKYTIISYGKIFQCPLSKVLNPTSYAEVRAYCGAWQNMGQSTVISGGKSTITGVGYTFTCENAYCSPLTPANVTPKMNASGYVTEGKSDAMDPSCTLIGRARCTTVAPDRSGETITITGGTTFVTGPGYTYNCTAGACTAPVATSAVTTATGTVTTVSVNPYASSFSAANQSTLNTWVTTKISAKESTMSATAYATFLSTLVTKINTLKAANTNETRLAVLNYILYEIQKLQSQAGTGSVLDEIL